MSSLALLVIAKKTQDAGKSFLFNFCQKLGGLIVEVKFGNCVTGVSDLSRN